MDKMKMESKNLTTENIEKIAEMFPNVITEAKDEQGNLVHKIDFEKLKQELSAEVIEGDESYDFTWVGKKQAMVEANKPTNKTLRPCLDESVNWENTENLYIEGDNLEVLKLLQESYLNKVKMIYIDPPYNKGNDSFIYPDDYETNKDQYDEEIGAVDESGYRMFKNTETNGRFHSSWCSMMYSRLKVARNLLTDDGVIFISIDDDEIENLRKMCDEIFGSSNFVAQIVVEGTPKNDPYIVSTAHEYCLVYTKDFSTAKETPYGVYDSRYNDLLQIYKKNGTNYSKTMNDLKQYFINNNYTSDNISNYKYADEFGIFRIGPIDDPQSGGPKDKRINPITGRECATPTSGWRCTLSTWNEWISQHLILFPEDDNKLPAKKTYISEDRLDVMRGYQKIQTRKDTDMLKKMFEENSTPFSNPKPLELIKLFIQNTNDKNAIICDFFAGSSTTAHAVMQLNAEDGGNRKFIMVQLPEIIEIKSANTNKAKKVISAALSFLDKHNMNHNICEIGKERIRRAGKKIVEETGKTNLDIGFRVLKLDESNMKDVYYTPDELSQNDLVESISNIKDGRSSYDLLYQCMLDWGLELSLPHKVERINNNEVHIVNDGDLIACFDNKISEETIKQIADIKPLRVVFRDSSFATPAARINVDEIFKLKSPHTTIKVL